MEITNHIPLIHTLLAAVNAHDARRVAQLHAVDYEGLDVSRALCFNGPTGAREALDEWLKAFPDLRMSMREVCEQAGQTAFFWTTAGTHEGVFLRVPPTGRRVEVCGVSLLTVQGGKITRGLHLWDMAGLLRSMKLLPDLPGHHPVSQADLLSRFLMNH